MKLKQKIDRTIALGSGGAFLGVLLFQIPGAVLGGIAAGLYGWVSARTKLKGLNPTTGEPTERFIESLKNFPTANPESKGNCAHCGEPVTETFPWYLGNPYKGALPVHEKCAKYYLFNGDNQ